MFLTEPTFNKFKFKIIGRKGSCNVSLQASSYVEMLSKAHNTLKICDEVYVYEFDTNHFIIAFDKREDMIMTFNPKTKSVDINSVEGI
jgi:hypothetical protein